MGELLIALHVTQQRLLNGMAWRHSLVIKWLHAGWQKVTATLRGNSPEGSVAKGCLLGGISLPNSCEAWLQTKSHRNSEMLYAEVHAILISWKFPYTVSNLQETFWYETNSRLDVTHIYTGCHRRNGPNFRRVFPMLNYTDITQKTYVPSWTVIEIMAK